MEEEAKENHKKIRIKSHGFIPFVISWCAIGLGFIILQKCFYFYSLYWDQGIKNALGIGSQIITACIVCILQILGISFSLQTNEWKGLKLYELREMRKDKHFSFFITTIISICSLIICIFCYSFELYIICIGASICAVILCVYVLYTELPLLTMNQDAMLKIIRDNIVSEFKLMERINNRTLLTMNQDAMLKIIRDNIVSEFKPNELLTSKRIKAIEYIILDKDVIAIYNSLKLNNQIEYNKHLLKNLLDIQEKMAFKLDTISDDSLKQKIIDNFWGTIRSIFNGKFDGEFNIIDILMEIEDYKRHIVSVLFQLLKHDKNGRISNTLFTDYIFFFNYEKNIKPIQQKLFTNAIVIIITETVKNNDLKYLSEFRKLLSLDYYTLSDNSNISLTFAIISFFLYYISELEQKSPEKLKENILEFIEYEGKGVVNNSWKKLFEYFACKFNIDYKRFVELYEENKSSIEYISSLVYWVTLSKEVVNDWFMANLLNKQDVSKDGYRSLLKDLIEGQADYLESFVKENFKGKNFVPSQKLLEIVEFYSNESDPFCTEKQENEFIECYYELKNEEQKKDAVTCADIKNENLDYKSKIQEILNNEWKFDKKIDLSNERSKYISIIFERNPDVINRDEFITKDVFANRVFNDIRKNINCTTIKRNDFTKQLNNIMQLDIKYTTGNTINLSYMIDNEGIRKSYIEYVSNKEKIQSNILVGYYFVLENGYSINIAIDSFTINDLNEKQLNQKVDEYSRADGQYVYEGVFMQREDVVRLIKNRFATYTLIFKYKLNINPEEIIRIEN